MAFKPDFHSKRWPKLTDAQVFEGLKAKCKVMPNGCWEFQGFCGPKPRNYGSYSYRGKARSMAAHRVAYMTVKGEIPKGMLVMHSCDNPPCCNPDHLSLGTHLENMAACRARERYHYANLTHCKRGHEFNEENTYYIKTPGPALGLRACKTCQRGRYRVKQGWPEHLAYSDFKVPHGYMLDRETGAVVSSKVKHRQATVKAL